MNRLYIILCIIFSLLNIARSSGQVIYVNQTANTGNNTGSSWQDAYLDLHDALSSAQYGDSVWVAEGVYFPTSGSDRNAHFALKDGIGLYGGFAGIETLFNQRDIAAHPVVLDGDIGTPGDSTDNSHTLLLIGPCDASTTVDGLTFRSGTASGTTGSVYDKSKSGAAIYISAENADAYPRIRNCRFERNYAALFGGAVYINGRLDGSVAPQFFNCVFEGNHAGFDGGAVFRNGGSWVETKYDFWDCAFINNRADRNGGGVFYLDSERTDTFNIYNCTFFGNNAVDKGSGVCIFGGRNTGSKILIGNCEFEHNMSLNGGCLEYLSSASFRCTDFILIDSSSFNTNPGNYGACYLDMLKLDDNTYSVFKNSTIIGHSIRGYTSSGAAFNLFSNNFFRQNSSIFLESDEAAIEKCIFLDNGELLIDRIVNTYCKKAIVENSLFNDNKGFLYEKGFPYNTDTISNWECSLNGVSIKNPKFET